MNPKRKLFEHAISRLDQAVNKERGRMLREFEEFVSAVDAGTLSTGDADVRTGLMHLFLVDQIAQLRMCVRGDIEKMAAEDADIMTAFLYRKPIDEPYN